MSLRLQLLHALADGTDYAIATKDQRHRLKPTEPEDQTALRLLALGFLVLCIVGIAVLIAPAFNA